MFSNITWQTYNWKRWDCDRHYTNGEHRFGCVVLVDSGIRTSPLVLVHKRGGNYIIPRGYITNDQQTDFDAAVNAVKKLTGFNYWKLDDSRTRCNALKKAIIVNKYGIWPEEQLNEHIRECIINNKRPHWWKPTQYQIADAYYVVIVEGAIPHLQSDMSAWVSAELARDILIEKDAELLERTMRAARFR
jgi:hypothetical protein